MTKKIPPTGWRPVRGGNNSKRLYNTTLWPHLQAVDSLLLPFLIITDQVFREVVAWT